MARKRKPYWMRYQRGWIGDRARFRLGEKGRQTGFTYMEAYRATSRRLSGKRRCDYWLSSADLDTARLFIEYCDHWCEFNRTVIDRFPVELFDEETQRPLALAERIVFKETGCKITAVSSNPRAIRGKHGDVTLDESAHHDDERSMWAAAGAVKQWGGELAVMSTHNGMGTLFNRLCKDAALSPLQRRQRGVLAWSHHRVTIEDAIADGLVEKINQRLPAGQKHTDRSFLDECRATAMFPEVFEQEYMCEPASSSLAWLTYEALKAIEADECPGPNEAPLAGTDGPRYVGVDVGRKQDLTAVWIGERVGDVIWTREIKNIRNLPLPTQEEILAGVLADTRVVKLLIDKTGIGLGLFEWLERRFGSGRIEGLTFTNQSKQVLANDLRQSAEDQKLRIPGDYELIEELHSVKKTVTATGLVRFDAERDEKGHADNFWGLALMVHAASAGERMPLWIPGPEGPRG